MLTEWTDEAAALFEEATRLRERGRYAGARDVAMRCLDALATSQTRARAATEREIGFTYSLESRDSDALPWYERSCDRSPESALSSLSLFHCLFNLGKLGDALLEALRFCSLRRVEEYWRMFIEEDAFEDSLPEQRELAQRVKAALLSHG
jgi:hypothetical protein